MLVAILTADFGEVLAVRREFNSLVYFCGYLPASEQYEGMFIGNAEVIPFIPRRYLCHPCMAYTRSKGLSKPVYLTQTCAMSDRFVPEADVVL